MCNNFLFYFFQTEYNISEKDKLQSVYCLVTAFRKNWYHIGTSQLIFIADQLAGFYTERIFTERQTLILTLIIILCNGEGVEIRKDDKRAVT